MENTKEIKKLTELSLLNANGLFISDTNLRSNLTGFAVKAIEATVIASIAYQSATNATSNTLVGETILAGDIWFLTAITSISLTSGAVFIYQTGE
tara:strand:+ start:1611 stop:1895 length:285 start_codon:yes stop_codon:yes gene_type:complete